MLRSILIVCCALFLACCSMPSPKIEVPFDARELDRQMGQLAENAESCMTEKQCKQSKKRHLKICIKAKDMGLKACNLRKEAKYTWKTNCKTAKNIVIFNDPESLKACCNRKDVEPPRLIESFNRHDYKKFTSSSLKELELHRWCIETKSYSLNFDRSSPGPGYIHPLRRSDVKKSFSFKCHKRKVTAVTACMRRSPASRASSYNERTSAPLKPSTPSLGSPAGMPVESSQPREY